MKNKLYKKCKIVGTKSVYRFRKLVEICNKKSISGYIGFDCTASLHVGSLLQIMILKLMQKHGHRPIVLLGGGTTLIGDPSARTQPENINQKEISNNIKVLKKYLIELKNIKQKSCPGICRQC